MKLDVNAKPFDRRCMFAKVFLDGAERHDVIVADEEGGFVEVYSRDEKGRYTCDRDSIKTEIIHGKVEIVLPEVFSKD